MGGVTGLDYSACVAVIKLLEVDEARAVLEDLQIMEVAAIGVLNKEVK